MLPYVILHFNTMADCEASLAKLQVSKRQNVRWTVEAVGTMRLKLAYTSGELKSRHTWKHGIVKSYLGDAAPPHLLLGPGEACPEAEDAAGAAAGSAEAAPRVNAPHAGALAEGPRSATASGVVVVLPGTLPWTCW